MRQWDVATGAYIFRGPFVGVDPVLMMDATISQHIPGSDLVLFYLSVDRRSLCYRIQNELYAIEHVLHAFESPVYLDQVTVETYRYQVLLGTGQVRESELSFSSELYPVFVSESALSGSVLLQDGLYLPAVTLAAGTEALSGSVLLQDGLYLPAVQAHSQSEPNLSGSVLLRDGLYQSAVQAHSQSEPNLSGSVLLRDSLYALAVIRQGVSESVLSASVTLLDGSYSL
ncbi:hypothetical protein ACFPRG_11615 [Deinococcus cellulosilyticus]